MISHIYFDWSGTLAKSNSKHFLISGTHKQKLDTLFPDTIQTLQYLYKRGYVLGIISNTSKNNEILISSLKEIGVYKYFKGTITFSNTSSCKKPCKDIFLQTLKKDKIKPQNCLMVGNNYKADILGALNAGIYTCFIDRENVCKFGKEDIHIHDLCELRYYL